MPIVTSEPRADPPEGIELHPDAPLTQHTYLRVGGPARYLAIPETLDDLARLLDWARRADLRVRVIGGGSNLLVDDAGVDALVISLRRAAGGVRFEGERAIVGAAVMLPALARTAAKQALSGLEFAIGIPGSVGGALNSNAGIGDGRSIGPLVESVEVLGGRGRATVPASELRFEYRRSSLRGAGVMVLGATLRLRTGQTGQIESEMTRLLTHRQATQPTAEPNAGSIFRNPEGRPRRPADRGCRLQGPRLGSGARQRAARQLHRARRNGERLARRGADSGGAPPRARAHGVQLQPEIEWWGDGEPPEPFAEPAPVEDLGGRDVF